uniref:TAR DNA-binding protein 43-like n=1 Tax=Styela clava TaxID=7725 RepID=UPI00193A8545|nr:TAR DNA-binding protein 43-like [Styela clava]
MSVSQRNYNIKQEIYIRIADDENEEAIEIPGESDGTMLLSSVTAQFAGACGLKYRNADTQTMRGVRLVEGTFHPPDGSWGSQLYIVVYPKDNKRKMDDTESQGIRSKRPAQKCSDLIVMGLPWETSVNDLKQYFGQFGELLKTHPETGKSKGYGFIKFADYEVQKRVTSKRHQIGGRWCDVKIPYSKQQQGQSQLSNRIFVGRVTEDMTDDDLRSYFRQFGEVTDVFVPKPFRPFAFITFDDEDVAASLCGEDHIINGVSVFTSSADPKSKSPAQNQGFNNNMGASGGGASGGFYSSGGGGFDGRNRQMRDHERGGWNRSHGGGSNPMASNSDSGGSFASNSAPSPPSFPGMPGNPNQFNMNLMNPAMLAAALGSWNQMLNGMMGAGGQMPGGATQMPMPPIHGVTSPMSGSGSSGKKQDGSGYSDNWNNNRDNSQKNNGNWQYNPYDI